MRKMSIALSLLTVAVALMSGCSASGPQFKAADLQSDQAVVYVYRNTHTYMGSGVMLNVKCDEQKAGTLINGGYVYRVLSPGEHVVTCTTEATAKVPFKAEAGESYYIEAEVEMGLFIGRPKLTMVPKEQGSLAILGTRLCGKESPQPATAPATPAKTVAAATSE